MKYETHSHTKYSAKDGVMSPKELVRLAKKRGLDGICITDHNTIKGGFNALKYASKDFEVIVGSEVKTDKGEVIGLFLKEEIKSHKFHKVIDEIKAQNGLIIVPHPFDRMRRSALVPKHSDAKYFDAIEGFNSRVIFDKYNISAKKYAKKHGLPIVAGSDAHFPNEVGRSGVIFEGDFRTALLKGQIKTFERKGWLINHAMTKVVKCLNSK